MLTCKEDVIIKGSYAILEDYLPELVQDLYQWKCMNPLGSIGQNTHHH